jgi:ribonuclease HI
MIEVYTDGLCEPINPKGIATYGIVISGRGSEARLRGDVGVGEGMSNQVAEYMAVYKALEFLIDRGTTSDRVIVYTDSQLVANQMNGLWKAKKGMYLGLYLKTKDLAKAFSMLSFQWIPREENKEADKLSQLAYEDHCASIGVKAKYRKR